MASVDSIPHISGYCDQSGCGLSCKLDVAGSFPALTEKGFLGLVSSTKGWRLSLFLWLRFHLIMRLTVIISELSVYFFLLLINIFFVTFLMYNFLKVSRSMKEMCSPFSCYGVKCINTIDIVDCHLGFLYRYSQLKTNKEIFIDFCNFNDFLYVGRIDLAICMYVERYIYAKNTSINKKTKFSISTSLIPLARYCLCITHISFFLIKIDIY